MVDTIFKCSDRVLTVGDEDIAATGRSAMKIRPQRWRVALRAGHRLYTIARGSTALDAKDCEPLWPMGAEHEDSLDIAGPAWASYEGDEAWIV
jgi:hypothetical protein